MVKTGLTAAGGLLTAAGAGLMVGVALMETFVVVHVPETGTCGLDDDTIAQIGVYTSSYDPKCAEGTPEFATFGRIATIESVPTLEFPLLFPTQTGYGGALGGQTGEFESCEDAWAAGSALSQSAFFAGSQGLFPQVMAGVYASSAIQRVELANIGAILPATFDGLVSDLWTKAANKTIFDINAAGTAVKDNIVPLLCSNADSGASDGDYTLACNKDDSGAGTIHATLAALGADPDCAQTAVGVDGCKALGAYANFQQTPPDAFNGLVGLTIGTDTEEQDFTVLKAALQAAAQQGDAAAGGGFKLLNLCSESKISACQGFYTLNSANATSASPNNDALCELIQLDSTKPEVERTFSLPNNAAAGLGIPDFVCNFDLTAAVLRDQSDRLELVIRAGLTESNNTALLDQLTPAVVEAALDIFNDCEETEVKTCVDNFSAQIDIDFANLPTNLKDDWIPAKFSGYEDVLEFFTATFVTESSRPDPTPDQVTAAKGLQAAVGVLTVCDSLSKFREAAQGYLFQGSQAGAAECASGIQEANLTTVCAGQSFQQFAGTIYQSVQGGASDCATIFDDATNPAVAFQKGYCVGLVAQAGDLATVVELLGLVLSSSPLPETFPDYSVTAQCLTAGAPTYIASGAGAGVTDLIALRDGLTASAANSLLEGGSREDLIKSCNDDEQDIAVFETAQMMVPAAIGCASVGMLLSFAAVATQKMPVALVGGLLSVAGGGILMGALLYIQSEAPVYKKLEESAAAPPQAGELYYQGGQAQLLALAAVGSSVVGGLVTIGSAFCGNGDEESSALTSKVDNTY